MGIALTSWVPRNGVDEYSTIAAQAIVDPVDSSIALVDPSGVAVVSPTASVTPIAQTTWTEDEGL